MNKTAVITGGTRGIGRACAYAFSEAGYRVAVIYLKNDEAAGTLKEDLRARGTDCETYRCDVADYA